MLTLPSICSFANSDNAGGDLWPAGFPIGGKRSFAPSRRKMPLRSPETPHTAQHIFFDGNLWEVSERTLRAEIGHFLDAADSAKIYVDLTASIFLRNNAIVENAREIDQLAIYDFIMNLRDMSGAEQLEAGHG